MIFPHKIWRPFWIAYLSYLLDPNIRGFWYICMLVKSQTLVVKLAELIVYHSTH